MTKIDLIYYLLFASLGLILIGQILKLVANFNNKEEEEKVEND